VTSDDALAGLTARLGRVRERIAMAEAAAGRAPGSVRLLLATKTVPAELIRLALEADTLARAASADDRGIQTPVLLGENRVQELVAKAPDLIDLAPELHLIGPLQSNKITHALRWATCVETVGSVELAARLAERGAVVGRVLDVFVQVNVSAEATKHGVSPDAATALGIEVAALGSLRLRGLMTIGANTPDTAAVRAGYVVLRHLRDEIADSGARGTADATELSMGMSGDLELAIAEGATIVRTGTAVFGSRPV
jgi:pyridoxal phosphate enzyme (YggS family)